MAHAARILADSISPDDVRLTTMEVVIPRIVLAEFNTHRMFSRNSASSRAIPVEKMLQRARDCPYVPQEFGANQKGMLAGDAEQVDQVRARTQWLFANGSAILHASNLLDLGVHKQLTNRLLEPWLWHTIIVSATEWDNFFHLRCHPHAHPDIRKTAELMREAMKESTPKEIGYGAWHLPLIWEEDRYAFDDCDFAALPMNELPLCSIGRCARVSYLTHDGRRDVAEDIALARRLLENGHMSPFEHVARPMSSRELGDRWRWIVELENGKTTSTSWGAGAQPVIEPEPGFLLEDSKVKRVIRGVAFEGNFNGWMQYRKTIPHEYDIKG